LLVSDKWEIIAFFKWNFIRLRKKVYNTSKAVGSVADGDIFIVRIINFIGVIKSF
jgi:hypothetical protein